MASIWTSSPYKYRSIQQEPEVNCDDAGYMKAGATQWTCQLQSGSSLVDSWIFSFGRTYKHLFEDHGGMLILLVVLFGSFLFRKHPQREIETHSYWNRPAT